MLLVVTGNIASGKTTVCKMIETEYGFYHINIDEIANIVLNMDIVKGKLFKIFGIDIFLDDTTINKKILGRIVFNNSEQMEKLTNVTHPLIIDTTNRIISEQKLLNRNILLEHPVLFEYFEMNKYDNILLITCPIGIRISRLMSRNNISKQEAIIRIQSQIEQDIKIEYCKNNNHQILSTIGYDVQKNLKNIMKNLNIIN